MPDTVSNSGPLIALAGIGRLDLLRQVFGTVVIPPAVRGEILDARTRAALDAADWIVLHPVSDQLAVRLLQEALHPGESEAIVLAQETSARWLLLDDRLARRKALASGLPVVGTLGTLRIGKTLGYLPAIKPIVDELRQNDFYVSEELYTLILQQAGELA